jgi:hypothetical protein
MNNSIWREKFLEAVSNCSDEGKEAVEYIYAHKTHIAIKRARKSVGAFWTLTRATHLNSVYYSQESSLVNPTAWILLIHEVRHLQQGWLTALSIYGELDAWQYQLRLQKKLTGKEIVPVLEEILSLPLNMERKNLQHASQLMTQYAGKGYGAKWLPLYPIHKEVKYWLTRMNN